MIHPYLLAVAPFAIYLANIMLNISSSNSPEKKLSATVALHQVLIYIGFCLAIYAYVENSRSLHLGLCIPGFVLELLGFWFSIWQIQHFEEKESTRHLVYVAVRSALFGLVLTCAIIAALKKYPEHQTLWYAVFFHALNFAGALKFGVLDWYVSLGTFSPTSEDTTSDSNQPAAASSFETKQLRQRKKQNSDIEAAFYL